MNIVTWKTVGLMILAAIAFGPVSAVKAEEKDNAAKPAAPAAPTTTPDAPGPAKFYGVISAVDQNAKTITIDGQAYHVVGESQMTKASDGTAATLADATVGEPARGSYTKSADGAMNITKVRFGKKSGGGKGGKTGGKKKSDATTEPDKAAASDKTETEKKAEPQK
jgi:hypothetical protein